MCLARDGVVTALSKADVHTLQQYSSNSFRGCTQLDAEGAAEVCEGALGRALQVWNRAVAAAARRMWCRRHIYNVVHVHADRRMCHFNKFCARAQTFIGNLAGVTLLYESKVRDADLRVAGTNVKRFEDKLENCGLWTQPDYEGVRALLSSPVKAIKSVSESEGITTVSLGDEQELLVSLPGTFTEFPYDMVIAFGVLSRVSRIRTQHY